MTPRRRRGLLLLCIALVCGGLAASEVREREQRAERALGPLTAVVVAQRDLPAERRLRAGDVVAKRLPARFLPPDALASVAQAAGARTAAPVAAGGYVTAGMLDGAQARSGPGALRAGERAVELAVAGGAILAGAAPGSRVDVVVSSEGDGGGRTLVALEDAELLGLRAAAGQAASGVGADAGSAAGSTAVPTAVATLRVTARQAIYLTAAANFAREIRLLVRPPGDRRRIGSVAVDAAGL